MCNDFLVRVKLHLAQNVRFRCVLPYQSSSHLRAAQGPKKVLVIGSGRVGRTIAHMLAAEDNYAVRTSDVVPARAATIRDELLNPDSGVKVKFLIIFVFSVLFIVYLLVCSFCSFAFSVCFLLLLHSVLERCAIFKFVCTVCVCTGHSSDIGSCANKETECACFAPCVFFGCSLIDVSSCDVNRDG